MLKYLSLTSNIFKSCFLIWALETKLLQVRREHIFRLPKNMFENRIYRNFYFSVPCFSLHCKSLAVFLYSLVWAWSFCKAKCINFIQKLCLVVYLKINVYFPCFPGLSRVDSNFFRKCPMKIDTKTIIPVLFSWLLLCLIWIKLYFFISIPCYCWTTVVWLRWR